VVGLGEEWDELVEALRDFSRVGVSILTIGQCLRLAGSHLTIGRSSTPAEFAE
jgi:lipoic acid synthetase